MTDLLLNFLRFCKAKKTKFRWLFLEHSAAKLKTEKSAFFNYYRVKGSQPVAENGILISQFRNERFLLQCRLNDEIEGKLMVNKLWEPSLMETIAAILNRKDGAMIDIGANVGAVSIPLAVAFPGKKFYSFEPHPTVVERLKQNIRLNYLQNVSVFQQAVSDSSGEISFYAQTGADNMGLSSLVKTAVTVQNQEIKVTTISLNEFVRNNNISSLSLVKIDVQGAELQVLQGMKEILNNLRPVILFEQEDSLDRGTAAQVRNNISFIFKTANYKLYAVETILIEEFGFAPELDLSNPFEGNILAIPQ